MERRTFIKTGSLATGALINPINLIPTEDKIKLGIVGVGWWGTDFILRFALESGHYEIIGLCDVDSETLKRASAKVVEAGGAAPKLFENYEELYEMNGLQAVAIVTPTHWHPLQFIAACKKGLDVWLEKPLSYDIREGQAMKEAHLKAGNIVTVDFPRLYTNVNSEVKNYIESGEAGEIRQIQFNIHSGIGIPPEAGIPETFNYEKFCGPAPKLPYRCGPKGVRPAWRSQHGFSRGVLADWGIHYLQNIREVMDLGLPNEVSAIGGIIIKDGRQHPDHLEVQFDFDGLPVLWTQKSWGFTNPLPHTNIGVFYFAEKATIWAYDTGWEVYPADKSEIKSFGHPRAAYGSPEFMEIVGKAFIDQFNSFAEGIRTKKVNQIRGSFEDGFSATSSIIYADLAYLTKASISIDRQTMDITNNEEAYALLKREYREPYQHPYLG
jgi:predicted dehydrogenase